MTLFRKQGFFSLFSVSVCLWLVFFSSVSLASDANSRDPERLLESGAEIHFHNLSKPLQKAISQLNVASRRPTGEPPFDVNQPFTLKQLFALPFQQSPEVLRQQAKLTQLQAQKLAVEAQDRFQLELNGRVGQWEYANKVKDRHRLALHASKSLFDDGALEKQQQSLALEGKAQAQNLWMAQWQYRLRLLQSYFQVLIADKKFQVANEKMAVVYVSYDKAKDRHALQEISDVEFLEATYRYQQALAEKVQAELAQQQTRRALANLMGYPEAIPDQLQKPDLTRVKQALQTLPSLEKLQAQTLQQNPVLQGLQKRVSAQQAKISAAQAEGKPKVSLDGWAGALSPYPEMREGHWRLDLNFNMPLYDAGLQDANIGKAKGQLYQTLASLQKQQQQLRDDVANLYFQLQLYKTLNQKINASADYADLYLDQRRALYEWEEKTDLGDAMVRMSQVDLERLQQDLEMAYHWATLQVLMGHSISLDLMPIS